MIKVALKLTVEVERRVQSAAHRALHVPPIAAEGAGGDSCEEDPAVKKLLARARKLPVKIAERLRAERGLQLRGDAQYKTQIHFNIEGERETEIVAVGGRQVEVVRKPCLETHLAVGSSMYLVDLDTKKAFQPPGGLRCPECDSADLVVTQMSHTMYDRSGVVPVVLANGGCSWVSGKGRVCRPCKAAGRKCKMFDYEGKMFAQMTENVQLQLPMSPARVSAWKLNNILIQPR